MRAISLRTARNRPWLSSWPVAPWKRRLNSSSLASASLLLSSSRDDARRFPAVKPVAISPLPLLASRSCSCLASRAWAACAGLTSALANLSRNDLALDGQLVDRAAQRLAGHRLGNTRQLEHDPAWLNVGDPPLGRALA